MVHGKKTWLIADGFWESRSTGEYPSHESVCVLNTGEHDAKLELTLYFEDRDKMSGFTASCPAGRCHHVRMDRLRDADNRQIPKDVPYAILVESDREVVVQYSRMTTAQSEMTLMTTIGYGC